MKTTQRIFGLTVVSLALVLVTGCDTPIGQMAGKLVTINGRPSNDFFKGIMDEMNAQQQAKLQTESPQTLQTIQHNDTVIQQQQQAAQASAQGQAPPTETVTPITVDDIKALTTAGVKTDAIKQEIEISKATFSTQDIAAAQQANVDPAVIECMKSHAS